MQSFEFLTWNFEVVEEVFEQEEVEEVVFL
jgi:hypothetical protein